MIIRRFAMLSRPDALALALAVTLACLVLACLALAWSFWG